MKIILALLVLIFSTSCLAREQNRFCFPVGDKNEPMCFVSINTLIARGDIFDGKIVIVEGYFAYADVPVLFSTKDDFLVSNTASGLVVSMPDDRILFKRLYGLNHRPVILTGRFSASPVDLFSNQGFKASGRIYDITKVSDAFMPWGYLEHAPPSSSRTQNPIH